MVDENESTVTLGKFVCPDCSYEHKLVWTYAEARQRVAVILAAVDGLMSTTGGARGGSG